MSRVRLFSVAFNNNSINVINVKFEGTDGWICLFLFESEMFLLNKTNIDGGIKLLY